MQVSGRKQPPVKTVFPPHSPRQLLLMPSLPQTKVVCEILTIILQSKPLDTNHSPTNPLRHPHDNCRKIKYELLSLHASTDPYHKYPSSQPSYTPSEYQAQYQGKRCVWDGSYLHSKVINRPPKIDSIRRNGRVLYLQKCCQAHHSALY